MFYSTLNCNLPIKIKLNIPFFSGNDCSVQEPCDSFDSTDVKNDSQNNDPSNNIALIIIINL